jgi:putative oxidoreductase
MGGLSEFCGGLLLALGFLNPLGSLAIISSMLVAIFMVHWPKVWAQESGLEYPLVNVAAASCLALGGMGLFSMDAALSIRLPSTAMFVVGLAFVLAGAGYVMSTASRPVLAVPVLTPEELEEEAEERRVA